MRREHAPTRAAEVLLAGLVCSLAVFASCAREAARDSAPRPTARRGAPTASMQADATAKQRHGSQIAALLGELGRGHCDPEAVSGLERLSGRARNELVRALGRALREHTKTCIASLAHASTERPASSTGGDFAKRGLPDVVAARLREGVHPDSAADLLAFWRTLSAVRALRTSDLKAELFRSKLARALQAELDRTVRTVLAPAAPVTDATSQPFVLLARWKPDHGDPVPGPIRVLSADSSGRVVLGAALAGLAAPRADLVVVDEKGHLVHCSASAPMLVGEIVPHFSDNPWTAHGRKKRHATREEMDRFWKDASKWLALPLVSCSSPLKQPVLAWSRTSAADGRAGPRSGRRVTLPASQRAQLVRSTASQVKVEPAFQSMPLRDKEVSAISVGPNTTVALVNLAWGDWPVCGADGHGASALWLERRGKWELVRLWPARVQPVILLFAGDLDRDGTPEILLERDGPSRRRDLLRIRQDPKGSHSLDTLKTYSLTFQDCPC